MKYKAKTRNWNQKKWVNVVLSKCLPGNKTVSSDEDDKYWIETTNSLRAIYFWIIAMLLRHWSGGWTYICLFNAYPDHKYKSIYWM